MAPQELSNAIDDATPRPGAVPRAVTYYTLAIASNPDGLMWSCICLTKKPSDAEIGSSDQVFRFEFPNTIVWTLVRGPLLTHKFCRRLAHSRFSNDDIWLHVDLSQFDMTSPRQG